jgi:putative protein kinase ArgK-like GTPase of G3E family
MRQTQALAVLLAGESVFLTGPPGSGKTYVLNEFIGRATRAGKTIAVTAVRASRRPILMVRRFIRGQVSAFVIS